MRNLPTAGPFPRRPLVWGSPPTPEDAGGSAIAPPAAAPVGGANGRTTSLAAITWSYLYNDGSLSGDAFPSAVRVATQGFGVEVGLVSIEMAITGLNASSDGILGAFIAKNIGSSISVMSNTNVLLSYVIVAGLSDASRPAVVLSNDVAPKLSSKQELALYVCAAGTGAANDILAVTITTRYFSV